MCPDHREPIAHRDDDLGIDAGQRARQDDMCRHVGQRAAVRRVMPMHTEQIAGISAVRIDRCEIRGHPRSGTMRIREILQSRQSMAGRRELSRRPVADLSVDDLLFQSGAHPRLLRGILMRIW